MARRQSIFMTGGTGYIGSRLIPRLLDRGHAVTALVPEQSRHKLPAGCTAIIGNSLDGGSYAEDVRGHHTFVQLVGVSHPSPARRASFKRSI